MQTGKDASGADCYYVRKGRRVLPKFQVSLDMRGAVCPGPIVEARRILEAMQPGEVLRLVSSCSAARDDIASWASSTGHALLETSEVEPGVVAFYLRN